MRGVTRRLVSCLQFTVVLLCSAQLDLRNNAIDNAGAIALANALANALAVDRMLRVVCMHSREHHRCDSPGTGQGDTTQQPLSWACWFSARFSSISKTTESALQAQRHSQGHS